MTYLTQHIVPALEASSFKPVTNEGEDPRPLLLLPWSAEGSSSADVTYVIVVDRLGARTHATWRGTAAHGAAMAFIGGDTLSSAGLVVLSFFVHHTTATARAAFEAESHVSVCSPNEYLVLMSIPSDGDDLGMTLLVRSLPCLHSTSIALSSASLSLSLSCPVC